MNGNAKMIMWAIGILMTIAGSVAAYAIVRVDGLQGLLQREYVQKVDYRDDVSDLKDSIKSINFKLDRLLMKRGDQ